MSNAPWKTYALQILELKEVKSREESGREWSLKYSDKFTHQTDLFEAILTLNKNKNKNFHLVIYL